MRLLMEIFVSASTKGKCWWQTVSAPHLLLFINQFTELRHAKILASASLWTLLAQIRQNKWSNRKPRHTKCRKSYAFHEESRPISAHECHTLVSAPAFLRRVMLLIVTCWLFSKSLQLMSIRPANVSSVCPEYLSQFIWKFAAIMFL